MKNFQLCFAALGLLLMIASCSSATKTQEENSPYLTIEDNQIQTKFVAMPDSSIDVAQLKEHYKKHPERWDVVFKYLAELDTNKLEFGRVDLSEDVFANFAEYTTKNTDESVYESHKDYIDVQYIVSGQEYIPVNHNVSSLEIVKAYDKEKDYMNYAYDGAKMLLANNQKFFIFFPSDAHMPCVKVGKNTKVKKLVLKVKYN